MAISAAAAQALGQTGASVGSGLFGSLIGAAFAKRNAKINAKLQYQNWQKMFDYEANYNTPKAQLDRLYDAQINPLFNSDYSGMQQMSPLGADMPTQTDMGFVDSLSTFMKLMLEDRQVSANENRVDAQNAADYAKASESAANAKLAEVKSVTEIPQAVAQIKALNAQASKDKKDVEYKDALISQTLTQAKVAWQQMLQGWDAANRDWQRVNKEWYETKWQERQGWFNASTDRMNAQTNRFNQEEIARHNGVMEGIESYRAKTDRNAQELARDKFNWQMKQDNFEALRKTIETTQHNIFGIKSISAKEVNQVLGVYGAIADLSPDEIQKLPDDLGMSMFDLISGIVTSWTFGGFLKGGASALGKGVASKAVSKAPIKVTGFQ